MQDLLFPSSRTSFASLHPLIEVVKDASHVEETLWDIPYTIKQLSYLSHSHYRYYGKFPPAVPAELIKQAAFGEHDYVLDNFCGSGTSLVEAKLAGIRSYGVDISWISALVSNVKVRHIDISSCGALMDRCIAEFESVIAPPLTSEFANKWFSEETAIDLQRVQLWLLQEPASYIRDFLLVGFLSIVRRVSRAYDAEVRPHVNPGKKARGVKEALRKKFNDMLVDHAAFQACTDEQIVGECVVGNNLILPKQFYDGHCALVISHPPYLNSFNYRPVFSLEFFWGQPFEHFYSAEKPGFIKDELIAHPASDDITAKYFAHLSQCYQATFDCQKRGGRLAVVIGDCTRQGQLIRVIEQTCEIVERIGYQLIQKNYRTTHYGLGKYAYKHRADYHGEEEDKRDAILVFQKLRN